MKPLPLVFLVNHPSPHMADLYRALVRRGDVDLHVVFMAAADPGRTWGADAEGYSHEFLPAGVPGRAAVTKILGERARGGVAIITMYTSPVTWTASHWLRSSGIPWAYLGEATMAFGAGILRDGARKFLFRRVADGASALLAISANAADDYARIGFPPERIHHVAYYMDTSAFESVERQWAPDGVVRFFSMGSLIPRKGFELLVEAFFEISRDYPQTTLRIVGEGPLRQSLEDLIVVRGLEHRARIDPPVPFAERHNAFREADVFVFPTQADGWGMVVSEALAAALPVIGSLHCGAARDQVRPGENGAIEELTSGAFAAAMAGYALQPELARLHGENARKLLRESWTPDIGAARFMEILRPLVEPAS